MDVFRFINPKYRSVMESLAFKRILEDISKTFTVFKNVVYNTNKIY